jgi:rod shape determining protein RodA
MDNSAAGFWYRVHIDPVLLVSTIILSLAGLAILYSAGGQDMGMVIRQSIRLIIGISLMFAVAQISPSTLSRWAPALYIVGIVLLGFVILMGASGGGARRWLDLGFIRFQPSEIMKILVPLMVASFFRERSIPPSASEIVVSLVLLLIPTLLIAKQPDLGTAMLVFLAGFYAVFFTGISWRMLGSAAVVMLGSAPLLWIFMHDYQRRRVLTLFDPDTDPLGAGYHAIQSKIAVGSGGIYGKGWLNGTQSNLEFLPERSTDFIFAVFCEEFGFIGVISLLLVYGIIIGRGFYILANAQSTFGKILAGALTLTFFTYVLVNMGMVIGRLPIVGIPLPLISYGGTSLVSLFIGFGILMSIHTHRKLLSG